MLIGNKSDAPERRKVKVEEAIELARELGLSYHEVSAKHHQAVEHAFLHLAHVVEECGRGHPSGPAMGAAKLYCADCYALFCTEFRRCVSLSRPMRSDAQPRHCRCPGGCS